MNPTAIASIVRNSLTHLPPAFKLQNQEIVDFLAAQADTPIPDVPVFDSTRVVDGQRLITFLKPLPTSSAGRQFEMRVKVIGVYDKGKAGSVVETQSDLVDKASGETYVSAVGSAFFVGQGGWGGPKGPATKNFPPPEGKKPDVVAEVVTTAETALLYRYVILSLFSCRLSLEPQMVIAWGLKAD